MPDSESSPLLPLFPGHPWLEAVVVGGTLFAANSIAAPQDPGWLALNPTPWLLLPVLSGLAHGFRWGFLFGAATSLALWAALPVLRPAASLPELLFFFSFPAAGLIAGGASRAAVSEKIRERQLRSEAANEDKFEARNLHARITALETERSATTARLAACQEELEAVSRQRETLATALTQSHEHAAILENRAAHQEIEARLAAETQAATLARRAMIAEEEAAAARQNAAVREDDARERLAALTAELAERNAALEALQASLSSTSSQLASEAASAKSILGERETLAAQLSGKEREIRELTHEREILASQLAEQRALAESASQELQDAHQRAIHQLVEDHNRHADRLTARLGEQDLLLQTLTAEHNTRAAQLTAERDARTAELAAKTNELTTLMENSGHAIQNLSAERDELASRLASGSEQLTQLENELRQAIVNLTAERDDLAARLASSEQLTAQLEERDRTIADLTTGREDPGARLAANHGLAAQLQTEREASENLTAERDDLAARLSGLQQLTAQLDERDRTIADLTTDREDLAARLAANHELAAQLQTEREASENLTAERDDLAARLSGLQQLSAELEERDRTIADLATSREDLAARLAANHELAAQLQTEREASENLTTERDELAARLAAQAEEIAGLHEQNHLLESRTAETGKRATHLDAEQQESAAQLAALNASLASITAERDAMADQLLGRKEEVQRLKTEQAALTSLLAEAEALAAAGATSATLPSETSSASAAEGSESVAEPLAQAAHNATDNTVEQLDSLRRERDQLQAQIAELLDTIQSLQAASDLSGSPDAPESPEPDSAPVQENLPTDFLEQLAVLTQQLNESITQLESLTAERDLLTAQLRDSGDALRRAEEMRHALDIRLADRNALLESMATRSATPPQPRRRMPRTVPLQPHAAERLTTRKVVNSAPGSDTADTHTIDSTAPDFFEDPPLPTDADADPAPHPAAGLDEPGSAPAEERIRSFFEPGAGPVFPQLLRLLEDIDGVTDAAIYQIDGPHLHRIALHGSEDELPETLPLDEVEIAHLAVRRQSFVTCRQVLATVPVQSSQWLAALPWPTTEMQSSALLLIHRMHPGAVNRRTFSHLQMLCRWVALFMNLHGHPANALSGEANPPPTSASGSESSPTGPISVSSEILQNAIADAAATHREHALPSSSLAISLTLAENTDHFPGDSLMDVLIDTIRPGLRSTDLLARSPVLLRVETSQIYSPSGRAASPTHPSPHNLEILLTFCDFEEAETIARTLADLVRNNSQLQDSVTIFDPALIGSPASN